MKSFYEFYLQIQRENAAAAAAPAAGAAPAAAPAAGAAPAAAPAAGAAPAAAPAAGAAPAAAGTVAAQAKMPSPSEVKAVTDLQVAMKKINTSGITNPETRKAIDAIVNQVDGMAAANQKAAQAAPAAPAKPGAPAAPVAPAKPGAPAAPVAPQK